MLTVFKLSGLAQSDSMFEASTISQADHLMPPTLLLILQFASVISWSEPLQLTDSSIGLTRSFRFKKLGINTVRVYTIDNSKNHDECMKALADAGIYLALDVNTPKYSLRQDKPAQSYNHVYLQNIFATIDEFAKYDNTLVFFSGNEDINNVQTSVTAPWVKAVTRDMKQYIGNRKYRKIPVGYSAADIGTYPHIDRY